MSLLSRVRRGLGKLLNIAKWGAAWFRGVTTQPGRDAAWLWMKWGAVWLRGVATQPRRDATWLREVVELLSGAQRGLEGLWRSCTVFVMVRLGLGGCGVAK